MPDEPRVQELLDELLDRQATPEEVCGACPDLLPVVRERWRQICRARAELDALLPISPYGSLPTTPPEELPLPQVPGYEVESVLGRGGMGVVYRARHLKLDRTVALKTLLAGAYAGPTERARFQREAEAVAGLSHANIVQIYEVGEHEGRPYFTMELVEGGSLAQKLASGPPAARWAAELVASLAEAVSVAHSAGIVHRDLKPANILLTAGGTPKISDFGIARRLQGEGGLTRTGAVVGTPGYMAPEQACGTAGSVGPAADVYGLGAVLYELLTGRPPFRAGTDLETLRQVLAEEPVPPSRLNSRAPRDLETVCLKCLRKEPHRRYPSAAALAADLRRYLLGQVVAARPVGNRERAGKWIRRNPAVASLSAAAVLALVAGTVASLLFALEAGRQADIATARAGKLEEQTRVAEENEEKATRILVSSWLNAIGRNQLQLTSTLDPVERDVVHQIRAAPAHIRLQFLEAALHDPDGAKRVGRRADWIMHAIVGCDPALRAEVEQRIVRRIQEPETPQEVLLACARLGLSVNIKDRVWAEHSAAAVIVALRDPTPLRNEYTHLAETLAAVSALLPPTRASDYAAQVIGVFLPILEDREKLTPVYEQLGQAVVVISPWLDEDAAARAAAALGAGIRHFPSYPGFWPPLAKALAAVCRRLPPPDATAHVHRTVDWIVERCSAKPEEDKSAPRFRAEALVPLFGLLDAGRAARVADAILANLVDRERIGPHEPEFITFTSWAEVLTALTERLDAPGTLRAAEELIRVLRKSEGEVMQFEQLTIALVTLCRRLDPAGAARVAEAVVVAVRDPKTSAGVRTIFASVLVAVGDQLDPVLADSLERALVDSLLTDLADVKSLRIEARTVAAVAEVCRRAGARSAARVADALIETIRNPQTPIELLPPLVTALGVAGGRLPPGEASSRAKRAIAVLASLWGTRTKPLDRSFLAEALAAAWTGVGPTEASAHAEKTVADLEDLLRDPKLTPYEESRLTQVLVVVYAHLGPAERAAHSNALLASHADTILAALRNPKNNLYPATRVQFAESLMALCMLLDPPEAVRVFDALVPTLSDLDMPLLLHRDGPIKKVLSRLDEADLRRLLEHPLAVGRLQRTILDALGEPKQRTFRNTWDYLDWTESH
jgi:hypothetical protein